MPELSGMARPSTMVYLRPSSDLNRRADGCLGTIQTLRILKKDVTEVKKGLECGMSFHDFSDLRDGDLIQFYQEIVLPGQL